MSMFQKACLMWYHFFFCQHGNTKLKQLAQSAIPSGKGLSGRGMNGEDRDLVIEVEDNKVCQKLTRSKLMDDEDLLRHFRWLQI